MIQRFLVEGKPGATCRSGDLTPLGSTAVCRTTTYFHNMIGLLSETVGNPTPMQIPFNPSKQLPRATISRYYAATVAFPPVGGLLRDRQQGGARLRFPASATFAL